MKATALPERLAIRNDKSNWYRVHGTQHRRQLQDTTNSAREKMALVVPRAKPVVLHTSKPRAITANRAILIRTHRVTGKSGTRRTKHLARSKKCHADACSTAYLGLCPPEAASLSSLLPSAFRKNSNSSREPCHSRCKTAQFASTTSGLNWSKIEGHRHDVSKRSAKTRRRLSRVTNTKLILPFRRAVGPCRSRCF